MWCSSPFSRFRVLELRPARGILTIACFRPLAGQVFHTEEAQRLKHPNHFGRWLACVLLCLLLAGCSMPGEQVQVEELLRAPKLSGDYGDVQTA